MAFYCKKAGRGCALRLSCSSLISPEPGISGLIAADARYPVAEPRGAHLVASGPPGCVAEMPAVPRWRPIWATGIDPTDFDSKGPMTLWRRPLAALLPLPDPTRSPVTALRHDEAREGSMVPAGSSAQRLPLHMPLSSSELGSIGHPESSLIVGHYVCFSPTRAITRADEDRQTSVRIFSVVLQTSVF